MRIDFDQDPPGLAKDQSRADPRQGVSDVVDCLIVAVTPDSPIQARMDPRLRALAR